ncbi:serine hydrolase domain-containing protein [Streptomyces sp. cg36]|uniref:serine hydrolase domain-containing protein n=1 Tax=Streptomyces sp. cg36 TaxID=3238798 RepID=UPI0034E1B8B8
MRTLLSAAVLLVAVPVAEAGAAAPVPPSDGLRSAVRQMVTDGFPGVVAYARDGRGESRAAAGSADLATGEPARPGQRFRIASNTKAFVSTVLLQLEGEGRLSLDDPVERWLPGVVRGHGNDGTAVTVRQLLNHTSGIYDPTTEPGFFAPYLEDHDWDHVYTPRQVIGMAVRHAPLFRPGRGWAYSNTNYLLAGLVIEAVTHRSAPEEIHRRIIAPLGLTHTSFPVTDSGVPGPHLHGYDFERRDVTRFSPSYDWTAGAMISTVDDLARFARALFTGRLLLPAQQRELQRTVDLPAASGYALGVRRAELPCGTPGGAPTVVWQTDGGGPGYTSMSLITADGGRQLVLAANLFDLAADLKHQPPVPKSGAAAGAMTAVLCR